MNVVYLLVSNKRRITKGHINIKHWQILSANLVEFSIRQFHGVEMQGAKLAELIGAPSAVTIRAPARITLVHVLLARDAFEERILDH